MLNRISGLFDMISTGGDFVKDILGIRVRGKRDSQEKKDSLRA